MEENTLQLADIQREDSMYGKYLTFAVASDVYGIEIRMVTEIIGVQAITEMPQIPHYIKGIINLRGKIIPVVDVRLRFGKEPIEYNDRTCIIVVERSAIAAGIIVDTVLEVQDIPDENISEPPTGKGGTTNQYVNGVARTDVGIRLLLDCGRILGEEISALADD